ncbi:bromodomain and PHD finger-containing protein [Annulohypoxylon truncatum]|uniref:bromodomain and PHD finger-containing protein n=1 Tax=Annulohypoxylon truncatum TaxID=327061 RepID=UPI0020076AAA|nr:bromodomain and PHD finger-containing protein [Annulohypoxylon truncatum]KAI1212961.1 bromodomain and PHD finger-containing protein [Annulohypoxylon truncatum]
MAPSPRTPRQSALSRPRGRPKGSINTVRRVRDGSIVAATEPPSKRRRYTTNGPGSASRFADQAGNENGDSAIATTSRSRARHSSQNGAASPAIYPRRERSTRTRHTTRIQPDDEMQISSAAAVAAVVQSEGYKPREERGWEEFHPNLDIDGTFMMFHAEDVDGTAKPVPETPSAKITGMDNNDVGTPSKDPNAAAASLLSAPNATVNTAVTPSAPSTTPRRRGGRLPRGESLYAIRGDQQIPPNTPTPLPIHGQNNKEKLDLKQPSYRKTDRILLFESKTFGQARYVDKAMMNVGYQESDNFIRPDRKLIKASDANIEDEADQAAIVKIDAEPMPQPTNSLGRVEYDMDEQDDMWLEAYNTHRKSQGWNPVTREVFEITITKIEKEWHALEKRIPKPNPKPPQTHRPRSSSAAAVNGEPQAGEEQDSKCAICDDGDCENTNAIVFCDGCDLAVHQECYGVPFIPEGQWLCRKCQLIGRGIPTCIFCPNSDGAFKQTNSSKWAHLLCAMWIPEVTLGNHTFMEPVMDVDKVPKSRWKLTCYICNQQMGACIQCGNKVCYQAFHVTCARRARLFLKMKNSSGALDVLDGSTNLKALCDKHCPSEYAKENDVVRATKRAKKFYKKTMKDRIWANSQAKAMTIAASHRNAITEHPPDESQMTGAKLSAVLGDKKGQAGKSIWKLPSGAPVIPQAVFENVEASLQRFNFLKRKEFASDACRYWTLKREMRRGAALLKRLQLQMESFSSMELTRRNFAAMGPSGKARLSRRIEFAHTLIEDLEQLKALSESIVRREQSKLEAAEMEQEFVDTCYFPVHKMLPPIVEKAIALDKNLFHEGLLKLSNRIDERFYTTTLTFTHDLCEVINVGINTEPKPQSESQQKTGLIVPTVSKSDFSDFRDRKKLGKRILKSIQPQLETALRLESEAAHKSFETMRQELESMMEASLELRQQFLNQGSGESERSRDVIMVDSSAPEITVGGEADGPAAIGETSGDVPMTGMSIAGGNGNIEVNTSGLDGDEMDGVESTTKTLSFREAPVTESKPEALSVDGAQAIDTPPATNGYVGAAPSLQPAPPTPPQSNGSLGHQPTDPLTDGGVVWYLHDFEPEGTSAIQEQWQGRDAVRSLSEELSEIDEDELKGLGVEINEDSITASPANTTETAEPAPTGIVSPTKKTTTKARKRKAPARRR